MANEKTPLLTASRKDEVVVKIPAEWTKYGITTSLTYEELLPFVIDASWVRARKVSFTAITIAFFVILLAACISAYTSMSKMSCGSMPAALLRSDNDSLGLIGEASVEGAKAVMSIVLNSTTT